MLVFLLGGGGGGGGGGVGGGGLRPVSYVTNVACVTVLSILDCSFGFL